MMHLGLAVVVLSRPVVLQARFNEQPADATTVMSTSRKKYDGIYRLSEVARVCGEVPKDLNLSGLQL